MNKDLRYNLFLGSNYIFSTMQNNTYSACFIGVTEFDDRFRGGLINTHSILGIRFLNEKFSDIGGFTSEELQLVYLEIFGEALVNVPKKTYGVSVTDNDLFISTYIGSGVYNIKGAMRIVLSSCNFTNIWNIDKTNSFALIQS